MIACSCLRLPFRGRKVKSPGNLNYRGFLELCGQLRVTAITWPVFSPFSTFHASFLFKPAGPRSVGDNVRLAEGSKAQRGWLHTARVGLTGRPAALERSGSAEAFPAPLVIRRASPKPRSSGLGRLCLAKPSPLVMDGRCEEEAPRSWIGPGNRIRSQNLLRSPTVSHGSGRLAREGKSAEDFVCPRVPISTSRPSKMN